MLKNLYIKNFVLIHEMTLDLQAGLSAFIGETGAGKSIFIDALGILAADRSSSSFVAKGAEKAIVEGTFCLGQDAHALRIMREAGLDVNDETVFTREINSQGKSTVRIDRRIVTLGLMKDVLRDQIDIHGQQDTQYLLSASRHLRLLDSFAGLDKEVGEVGALYRAYAALVKEKEEVLAQRYGRVEKEEIEYQIREIEQAHLKAEEEEELREKEKQYKAVKNSFERLQAIVQLYDEQLDEPLYMLDRQIGGLDSGTELLQARDAVRESLSTLNAQIEFIRGTLDDMNMTEEDVNLLQERLYVIQKLKHKYAQPSIAALLSFQESLEARRRQMEDREGYLAEMEEKIRAALAVYTEAAAALSRRRQNAAKALDEAVAGHLRDLFLPHARFKTSFTQGFPSAYGSDRVEFLISMNPGEDLKPLVKTASGGELSRLMLGLKAEFTHLQGIGTVVFDEIDTGVSGQVAGAIGQKMKEIAKTSQVLVVTHLAPVAACADRVYLVSKVQDRAHTETRVAQVEDEALIDQLALMFAGEINKQSQAAAKDLYVRSQR